MNTCLNFTELRSDTNPQRLNFELSETIQNNFVNLINNFFNPIVEQSKKNRRDNTAFFQELADSPAFQQLESFARLTGFSELFNQFSQSIKNGKIKYSIRLGLRLAIGIQSVSSFYFPTGNFEVNGKMYEGQEAAGLKDLYIKNFAKDFLEKVLAIKEVKDLVSSEKITVESNDFIAALNNLAKAANENSQTAEIINKQIENARKEIQEIEDLYGTPEKEATEHALNVQNEVIENIDRKIADINSQIAQKQKENNKDFAVIGYLWAQQTRLQEVKKELVNDARVISKLANSSDIRKTMLADLANVVLENTNNPRNSKAYTISLGNETVVSITSKRGRNNNIAVIISYQDQENRTITKSFEISPNNVVLGLQKDIFEELNRLEVFDLYNQDDYANKIVKTQAENNSFILHYYPAATEEIEILKSNLLYKIKKESIGELTPGLFNGLKVNGQTLSGNGQLKIVKKPANNDYNKKLQNSPFFNKSYSNVEHTSPYTLVYEENGVIIDVAAIRTSGTGDYFVAENEGQVFKEYYAQLKEGKQIVLESVKLGTFKNSAWADSLYGKNAQSAENLKTDLENKGYRVSKVFINTSNTEDNATPYSKVDIINKGRPFIVAFPSEIKNPNLLVAENDIPTLRERYNATIYYLSWPTVTIKQLQETPNLAENVNQIATEIQEQSKSYSNKGSNIIAASISGISIFKDDTESLNNIKETYFFNRAGRRAILNLSGHISPGKVISMKQGLGFTNSPDFNKTEGTLSFGALEFIYNFFTNTKVFDSSLESFMKPVAIHVLHKDMLNQKKASFGYLTIHKQPVDYAIERIPINNALDSDGFFAELNANSKKNNWLSGAVSNGNLSKQNFVEGVDYVVEYGLTPAGEQFFGKGKLDTTEFTNLQNFVTDMFNKFNLERSILPYARELTTIQGTATSSEFLVKFSINTNATNRRTIPGFPYTHTKTDGTIIEEIGSYKGNEGPALLAAILSDPNIKNLPKIQEARINPNTNINQEIKQEAKESKNINTLFDKKTVNVNSLPEEIVTADSLLSPQRPLIILPSSTGSPTEKKIKELEVTTELEVTAEANPTEEESDTEEEYNPFGDTNQNIRFSQFDIKEIAEEEAIDLVKERLGEEIGNQVILTSREYVKGFLGMVRKGIIYLKTENKKVDFYTTLHEIFHKAVKMVNFSTRQKIYEDAGKVSGIDTYMTIEMTVTEAYQKAQEARENGDIKTAVELEYEIEEALARYYSFNNESYTNQAKEQRLNQALDNKYKNKPAIIRWLYKFIDEMFQITERTLFSNEFEKIMYALEGRTITEYAQEAIQNQNSGVVEVDDSTAYNIKQGENKAEKIESVEVTLLSKVSNVISPAQYTQLKKDVVAAIDTARFRVSDRIEKYISKTEKNTFYVKNKINQLKKDLEDLSNTVNSLTFPKNIEVQIKEINGQIIVERKKVKESNTAGENYLQVINKLQKYVNEEYNAYYSQVQENINTVKESISTIRGEIASTKSNIQSAKNQIKVITFGLDQDKRSVKNNQEIKAIKQSIKELESRLKESNEKLANEEKTLTGLNAILQLNSNEITSFKDPNYQIFLDQVNHLAENFENESYESIQDTVNQINDKVQTKLQKEKDIEQAIQNFTKELALIEKGLFSESIFLNSKEDIREYVLQALSASNQFDAFFEKHLINGEEIALIDIILKDYLKDAIEFNSEIFENEEEGSVEHWRNINNDNKKVQANKFLDAFLSTFAINGVKLTRNLLSEGPLGKTISFYIQDILSGSNTAYTKFADELKASINHMAPGYAKQLTKKLFEEVFDPSNTNKFSLYNLMSLPPTSPINKKLRNYATIVFNGLLSYIATTDSVSHIDIVYSREYDKEKKSYAYKFAKKIYQAGAEFKDNFIKNLKNTLAGIFYTTGGFHKKENGIPVILNRLKENGVSFEITKNENNVINLDVYKHGKQGEKIKIASIAIHTKAGIGANFTYKLDDANTLLLNSALTNLPLEKFKEYFPGYKVIKEENKEFTRQQHIVKTLLGISTTKHFTNEMLDSFTLNHFTELTKLVSIDILIHVLDAFSRISSSSKIIESLKYRIEDTDGKKTNIASSISKSSLKEFENFLTPTNYSALMSLADTLSGYNDFIDLLGANAIYGATNSTLSKETVISRTSLAAKKSIERLDNLISSINQHKTPDTIRSESNGLNLLIKQATSFKSFLNTIFSDNIHDLHKVRPSLYNGLFKGAGLFQGHRSHVLNTIYNKLTNTFKPLIEVQPLDRLRYLYEFFKETKLSTVFFNSTKSDKTMQYFTEIAEYLEIKVTDINVEDVELEYNGKKINTQKFVIKDKEGNVTDLYVPVIENGTIVYKENYNATPDFQSEGALHERNSKLSVILFDVINRLKVTYSQQGGQDFPITITSAANFVTVTVSYIDQTGRQVVKEHTFRHFSKTNLKNVVITTEMIAALRHDLNLAISQLNLPSSYRGILHNDDVVTHNGTLLLNDKLFNEIYGDEQVHTRYLFERVLNPIVNAAREERMSIKQFIGAITQETVSPQNVSNFLKFYASQQGLLYLNTFIEVDHPNFWKSLEDAVKRAIWSTTRGSTPSPVTNNGNENPMAMSPNTKFLIVEDASVQSNDSDPNTDEHTIKTFLEAAEIKLGDNQLQNGQIFQNKMAEKMMEVSRGKTKSTKTHKKEFFGSILKNIGVFMNKASTFTITNEYLNNGTAKAHAYLFATLGGTQSPIFMMWNHFRYQMILQKIADEKRTSIEQVKQNLNIAEFEQGKYYHPSQFRQYMSTQAYNELSKDFNEDKDWSKLFDWFTSEQSVGENSKLGRLLTDAEFAVYASSIGLTYITKLTNAQIFHGNDLTDASTKTIEEIYFYHRVATPSSTKLGAVNKLTVAEVLEGNINTFSTKNVSFPTSQVLEILPLDQATDNEEMPNPNQMNYINPSTRAYNLMAEFLTKRTIKLFQDIKLNRLSTFKQNNYEVLVKLFLKSDLLAEVLQAQLPKLNTDVKTIAGKIEEKTVSNVNQSFSEILDELTTDKTQKTKPISIDETAQSIEEVKKETMVLINKAFDKFVEQESAKTSYVLNDVVGKYVVSRAKWLITAVQNRLSNFTTGLDTVLIEDPNLPVPARHYMLAGLSKGQQVAKSEMPGFRAVNNTTNGLIKVYELQEDLEVDMPLYTTRGEVIEGNYTTITLPKGTAITPNIAMQYNLAYVDNLGNIIPNDALREAATKDGNLVYRNMAFYRLKTVDEAGKLIDFISDRSYSFYLYVGYRMRENQLLTIDSIFEDFVTNLEKDPAKKEIIKAIFAGTLTPEQQVANAEIIKNLNIELQNIEQELQVSLGTITGTGFAQPASADFTYVKNATEFVQTVDQNPSIELESAETIISSNAFSKASGIQNAQMTNFQSTHNYLRALKEETANRLLQTYLEYKTLYSKLLTSIEAVRESFSVIQKQNESLNSLFIDVSNVKDLTDKKIEKVHLGTLLAMLAFKQTKDLSKLDKKEEIVLYNSFLYANHPNHKETFTVEQIIKVLEWAKNLEDKNNPIDNVFTRGLYGNAARLTPAEERAFANLKLGELFNLKGVPKHIRRIIAINYEKYENFKNAKEELSLLYKNFGTKVMLSFFKENDPSAFLKAYDELAANYHKSANEYAGVLQELNNHLLFVKSFLNAKARAISEVIAITQIGNSFRATIKTNSKKGKVVLEALEKQANSRYNAVTKMLQRAIGVRIPTSGLNSVQGFKVIDFLSQSGNTIFNTDVVNFVAGSDNDADMISLMLQSFGDLYKPLNKAYNALLNSVEKIFINTSTTDQTNENVQNIESIDDVEAIQVQYVPIEKRTLQEDLEEDVANPTYSKFFVEEVNAQNHTNTTNPESKEEIQRQMFKDKEEHYVKKRWLSLATTPLNMGAFTKRPSVLKTFKSTIADLYSVSRSLFMNFEGKRNIGPFVKTEELRKNINAHKEQLLEKMTALTEVKENLKDGVQISLLNKLITFLEKFTNTNNSIYFNNQILNISEKADFILVSGTPKIFKTTQELSSYLESKVETFAKGISNFQKGINAAQEDLNTKNLTYTERKLRENFIKSAQYEIANIEKSINNIRFLQQTIQENPENSINELISANDKVLLSLTSHSFRIELGQNNQIVYIPYEYTNGLQKSEAGVNSALDNAKNPVLTFWNFSLANAGLVNALSMTGISNAEEFMQNPLIRELTTELARNRSNIDSTSYGIKSFRDISKKLKEKVKVINVTILNNVLGEEGKKIIIGDSKKDGLQDSLSNASIIEKYRFIEQAVDKFKELVLQEKLKDLEDKYPALYSIIADRIAAFKQISGYKRLIAQQFKDITDVLKTIEGDKKEIYKALDKVKKEFYASKQNIGIVNNSVEDLKQFNNNLTALVTLLNNTGDEKLMAIAALLQKTDNNQTENNSYSHLLLQAIATFEQKTKEQEDFIKARNAGDKKEIDEMLNVKIQEKQTVKSINLLFLFKAETTETFFNVLLDISKAEGYNDMQYMLLQHKETLASVSLEELRIKFIETLRRSNVDLTLAPLIDPITGKIYDKKIKLLAEDGKTTFEVSYEDLNTINTYLNFVEVLTINNEINNTNMLIKLMSKEIKTYQELEKMYYDLDAALNLSIIENIPDGIFTEYELAMIESMQIPVEKALMQRILLLEKIDLLYDSATGNISQIALENVKESIFKLEDKKAALQVKEAKLKNRLAKDQKAVDKFEADKLSYAEKQLQKEEKTKAKADETKTNENIEVSDLEYYKNTFNPARTKANEKRLASIAELTPQIQSLENEIIELESSILAHKESLEKLEKTEQQHLSEYTVNPELLTLLNKYLITNHKIVNPYLLLYNKKVLQNVKYILLMQAELAKDNLLLANPLVKELIHKEFSDYRYNPKDVVVMMQDSFMQLIMGHYLNEFMNRIGLKNLEAASTNFLNSVLAVNPNDANLSTYEESIKKIIETLKEINPTTIQGRKDIANNTYLLYATYEDVVNYLVKEYPNHPMIPSLFGSYMALNGVIGREKAPGNIDHLIIQEVPVETIEMVKSSLGNSFKADVSNSTAFITQVTLMHSLFTSSMSLSFRSLQGILPDAVLATLTKDYSEWMASHNANLHSILETEDTETLKQLVLLSLLSNRNLAKQSWYGTATDKGKTPLITEENIEDVDFEDFRALYEQEEEVTQGAMPIQVNAFRPKQTKEDYLNEFSTQLNTQLSHHLEIDPSSIAIPVAGNIKQKGSKLNVEKLPSVISVNFNIRYVDIENENKYLFFPQMYKKVLFEKKGVKYAKYIAIEGNDNKKLNTFGTVDTKKTGLVFGMNPKATQFLQEGHKATYDEKLKKVTESILESTDRLLQASLTEEQQEQKQQCSI